MRRSVPRCTTSAAESNASDATMTVWRFQWPFMSVQGDTGVPPPQMPLLHVSPVVQTAPSSQALPSDAGTHIDGSPVHVQHGSTWHSASQPSPGVVLPSSHVHRVAKRPPTAGGPGGTRTTKRPSSRLPLGMNRPPPCAMVGLLAVTA